MRRLIAIRHVVKRFAAFYLDVIRHDVNRFVVLRQGTPHSAAFRSAFHYSAALRVAAIFILIAGLALPLCAQQNEPLNRIALVIGNSNYEGTAKLKNPVNDAQDIGAALSSLGFDAEILTDADLYSMEDSVLRFRDKLAASPNSVGFFYYAGHGVQSAGENYLIPVDARLNSESMLRTRAIPLQFVLDSLSEAHNKLNIIVLDACRDNPFSWARSSARGLAVVGQLPPASIVVYSTSAGKVAQDGTGRNGMFTEELLKHLSTPGLDITEVLRRTGEGVQAKTDGAQIPAIYSQFFGFLKLAGEGEGGGFAQGGAQGTIYGSPQSGPQASPQSGPADATLDYLPAFFDEAPQNTKLIIAKAEELTWDEKWLSAWRLLQKTDPNNRDPYILAEKIRTALDGNSYTDNYKGFSFYDAPSDGDVDKARADGTIDEEYFDFDPHAAVQRLLDRGVDIPPILALALGDFYYNVYNYNPDGWSLTSDEILAEGLRWFDLANEQYIVVDTTSVIHYAELLMNAGRSEEAVTILSDQVEWEPDDSYLRQTYADALAAASMIDEALGQYDILISKASSKEEALEYYKKAIDLAYQNDKKEPLERYLAAFEKDYPDDWYAPAMRHRLAVNTGDSPRAQKIAKDIVTRFPPSVSTDALESILTNWLQDPAGPAAGLSFLDSTILTTKNKPRDLGIFYLYRALYRYYTVQEDPPSKTKETTIQRSFEDLDSAETYLRQTAEPEDTFLDTIKTIREQWSK
jgi:hypothetical protein